MAKIKKNELKQMKKEEMDSKMLELKKELLQLRGQTASGAPIKSPGLIRAAKRNIARIYTYKKLKEETK